MADAADDPRVERIRHGELSKRVDRLRSDRAGSASRYLGTVTGVSGTATAPVRVATHPTSVVGPIVAGEPATLRVHPDRNVLVDVIAGQVRDGDRLLTHRHQGRWVASRGTPCTTRSIRVAIGDSCGPIPVTIRYEGPGVDETRVVTLTGLPFGPWSYNDYYEDPPAGAWTITVSAEGRYPRVFTVNYGPNCTEVVTARLCTTTVHGTITLVSCPNTLNIPVPVAGAAMTLTDPEGDLVASGSTDENGEFSFTKDWPEEKCALADQPQVPGRIEVIPPGGIGLLPFTKDVYFFSRSPARFAICDLSRTLSFTDATISQTGAIDPDWECVCGGLLKRTVSAQDKYGAFEMVGGGGLVTAWSSERGVFDPDGKTDGFGLDAYGHCVAFCKEGGAPATVSYELSCITGGPYGNTRGWRLTKATTTNCGVIGPVTFYDPADEKCPPDAVPYQTNRQSGLGVFEFSDIFPSPFLPATGQVLVFDFDNSPTNGATGMKVPVDGFADTVTVTL